MHRGTAANQHHIHRPLFSHGRGLPRTCRFGVEQNRPLRPEGTGGTGVSLCHVPLYRLSLLLRFGRNRRRRRSLSTDLAGQTTLLAGHSGVGKSSLINRLVPGINLRTAEISDAHRTGMHTTTFSQMIALPGSAGGYLIDTPGVKGFGTIDMAPEEVGHYFPEIFRESAHCRFNNCSHTHEPGCAVLAALEEGRIPQSRYTSYLGIMEDKDETKYRQDH